MRWYTWGVIPLSPCMHLYTFWMTPLHSFSCTCTKWMAYFSTKKQITTFEYCIHWNINIRKKNIFFTKQNQKTNSAMSIMLCTGANFAKKNSCLVARIVPCYTTGLHLLIFNILETYPSKDIALGGSHVISH